MDASDLLSVRPTLPEPDDPQMCELLAVLAAATGADGLVLDVQLDREGPSTSYRVGSPSGNGERFDLVVPGHFSAVLQIDAPKAPAKALLDLASLALDGLLTAFQVKRQTAIMRAMLDTSTTAVLLFDRDGNIVYANPPANRLLESQMEANLTVDPAGDGGQPLFTVLCSVADGMVSRPSAPGQWQGIFTLAEGWTLSCEVRRLRTPASERPTGVVAVLRSAAPLPPPGLPAVGARFGFSRREEEVAGLVMDGCATVEIADRLSISQHTVRDHVKSLYRKTGTCSRRELLKALSSSGLTTTPSPML